MNKKNIIKLANAIRKHNSLNAKKDQFNEKHLATLVSFCAEINDAFMCDRWLDYIAGKCGPNGGSILKER